MSEYLAFLKVHEIDNKHRGGILLINDCGIPSEFYCTSRITPNNTQKILFGKGLFLHIVELVGRPLIAKIQNKPTMIIVDNDTFLELRRESDYPIIFARRQGEEFRASDKENKTSNSELLVGKFQPLILTGHPEYPDDVKSQLSSLCKIFNRVDLLEPFERITQAILEIDKQGKF